jgi:hypothetical protein
MLLRIAGLGISLESEVPDLAVIGSHEGFVAGGGTVEARFCFHYGGRLPDVQLTPRELAFDSGSLWRLYRQEDQLVYEQRHPPDFLTTKLGFFRPDGSQGDVYVKLRKGVKHPRHIPWEYPLAQWTMLLVLAQHGGLMFHACGVKDGERGYLFAGNSTHGKSTMAMLWRDRAAVLGDDRIVVRLVDGQLWMYGTPWHGDCPLVSAEGVPIHRVFFLHHANENEAVVRTGLEAGAMLFARSFPPLWDGAHLAAALELCGRVSASIPCADLGFVPDQRVVDYVREWAR